MPKRRKTVSADSSKAKADQLKKEWEALLARHSRPLERGAVAFGIKKISPVKKVPRQSEVVDIKIPFNLNSMMGIAAKAEPKVYTGTKIIGIATMHKSNMVPIFNEDAAIDVAKMRRG